MLRILSLSVSRHSDSHSVTLRAAHHDLIKKTDLAHKPNIEVAVDIDYTGGANTQASPVLSLDWAVKSETVRIYLPQESPVRSDVLSYANTLLQTCVRVYGANMSEAQANYMLKGTDVR